MTANSLWAFASAGVVVIALMWVMWRQSLLTAQSKAMEVQQAALEAYETRIKQLEDKVAEQDKKMAEQDRKMAELEGVIEGKDGTIKAIIDAIADTDRCLAAVTCPNRVVPTA